jgi:outer membrane protein OmpA-like peptidoglycan-associated protein
MKSHNLITHLLPLVLGLYLMTAGCAAIVVGAGAGAGTLAYFEGELKENYEADYDKTVKACADALTNLKIPVIENPSDALQTIFKAERPDGTPVTVKAVRLNEQVIEVSVRTGIVGLWDKNVSMQIHESIRREMNRVQQLTPVISETTLAEESAPQQDNTPDTPEEAAVMEAGQSSTQNEFESASQDKYQAKLTDGFPFAERKVIIHFQHNSNEIPAEAYLMLNRIAKFMVRNSEARIKIKGYPDSFGAYSYNIMISEQRANTIKNYLIAKGVKPGSMTALGLGPQDFVAGNESEEGRRLNRRVEIEFNSKE